MLLSGAVTTSGEHNMNVKQLPAFIYVKHLHSGVVLNKNTEPIAYAEDPADLSWITDYDKHRLKWKLNP